MTLERARHLASTQRFLRGVLKDWPLRTAAATDPLALGVFPPVCRAGSERLGPYVPRTADERVDRALRAGGLVLVVGPERAGKSRTAYEALLRILPANPVLVPLDGSGLSALTTEASFDPEPETVWWLDDLERFLPDLGGAELAALLDGGRTVVATIREAAWRSLLHAGGEDGERGRRLLAAAHVIHLPTALDQREADAAAELYPGTDLSRGIGEALGAGDDASPWVSAPAEVGE